MIGWQKRVRIAGLLTDIGSAADPDGLGDLDRCLRGGVDLGHEPARVPARQAESLRHVCGWTKLSKLVVFVARSSWAVLFACFICEGAPSAPFGFTSTPAPMGSASAAASGRSCSRADSRGPAEAGPYWAKPSAGDDHNAESNSKLSRPGNGRVGPVICSLPVFHS